MFTKRRELEEEKEDEEQTYEFLYMFCIHYNVCGDNLALYYYR